MLTSITLKNFSSLAKISDAVHWTNHFTWSSWLPWIDITARRYVPSKTCRHLIICICSQLRGKMPKAKVKTNPRLLISHKLISYIHEDWTDTECLSGLKSLTFLLIFCHFIFIILHLKCSVFICFGGSLYLHLTCLIKCLLQ